MAAVMGAAGALLGGVLGDGHKVKEERDKTLKRKEKERAELLLPYRVFVPMCPLLVAAKAALLHHHYDTVLIPKVQDRDKLLQEKELLVKRSKSTGSVLVRARACTRCN